MKMGIFKTIAARLAIAFLVVLSFSVGLYFYLSAQISVVVAQANDIYEHPLVVSNAAGDVQTQGFAVALKARNILLGMMPPDMAVFKDNFDTLHAELKKIDALYMGDRTKVQALETAIGRLEQGLPKVVEMAKRNEQSAALDLIKSDLLPAGEVIRSTGQAINKGALEFAAKFVASANESHEATKRNSMIVILVGAVTCLLITVFTAMSVTGPIGRLRSATMRLADGDLQSAIPDTARGDELGSVFRALVVLQERAREAESLRAEQSKIEQRQVIERKADMSRVADNFEKAVRGIIETVSASSAELETSAGTLAATAGRAQEVTVMVAAASEEASANVQSVASASEELTSSVNEISRQVQESARIAAEAVDQAQKTNMRVGELSKSANRIGDVVELINTIAGQTNLLALNATIEAARAGEAGRGFAVVASEVKALAEQTAKATGEISQQISGIQVATQESVDAIREISNTIGRLSEISSTIAASVEEQGVATLEISRNVQQAAQGTQEVSSNVVDVQRGASETSSASSQVLSAARSLSAESSRLRDEVGEFLKTVRAA